MVRALDTITDRGATALVLELAAGRPFDAIIAEDTPDLGRFVVLALAAARALADVHRYGFVHRDVKPHHFFFNAETGEATMIDFGLATALPRERHLPVEIDRLEGTLPYISPEQTGRINHSVDRRSDLYSLGVTLYELATGRLPFESEDALELVHAHIARTPPSPRTHRPDLPAVVEQLILRLLAKNPDHRYQTSAGLVADLERIQKELASSGTAASFELGQNDHDGQLRVPEKLYGRAAQSKALLEAVGRAQRGALELMLISGQPGIGKSALVHEVHREIVRGGHFVSGKFDQYNRGIPYSALAGACGELVRAFLASPAEQLDAFRRRLAEALGENAQVVVEVVPELALAIGEQPPVAPLPPNEAQIRFQRMLRRFMEASACEASPLVLFIDDLQWADSASLAVLELVLTAPTQGHLLVIGNYRDTEVDAAHPLSRSLERIGRATPIQRIELGPLTHADVQELVGDALSLTTQDPAPLARLIAEKTSGNPFFVGQFLERLAAEGHLTFQPHRGFCWNLETIGALGATDNVVDLVVQRLGALEPRARELLELAACIGHTFRLRQLAVIAESTPREVATALAPAVTGGYLLPLDQNHHLLEELLDGEDAATVDASFKFAHDRVQQAALATIGLAERARVHLRIGRQWLSATGAVGPSDDQLFEIVAQLNMGRKLIDSDAERLNLARLNLRAAERAKSGAAHGSVIELSSICLELLGAEPFGVDHETSLAAHLLAVESHHLSNESGRALELIDVIERHAKTALERVPARNLKTTLITNQGDLPGACAVSVETIRLLGIALPDQNDQAALGEAIGAAFAAYQQAVGAREVASLRDLPAMTDPEKLALLSTMAGLIPAAFQSNPNLMVLTVLTAVRLPIEYGTGPMSPFFYGCYGLIHHLVTGDYTRSHEFGLLALELGRRPEHVAARAAAEFIYGAFISPWVRPISESHPHFEQAAVSGLDFGDHLHAAYAMSLQLHYRLQAGEELSEVLRPIPRIDQALAAQGDVINRMFLTTVKRSIACLRGTTSAPGSMDGDGFSEMEFERDSPATATGLYAAHKAMLRYLFGDPVSARDTIEHAVPNPGLIYKSDYAFFHGLACAELAARAEAAEKEQLLVKVDADLAQLSVWARNCPHNFAAPYELLRAERHAACGNDREALDAYESAIEAAEEGSAIHHLALSHERAGRFHLRAGRKRLANSHLRDAVDHYDRWGATGKVRQLREEFPKLAAAPVFETDRRLVSTVSHGASPSASGGGRLDLISAMRAVQAIASELRLEPLLRRLMRILVENAGATRGVLVLPDDTGLKVRASFRIDPEEMSVALDEPLEASRTLALSVVQYCTRSGDPVAIDDIARDRRFAQDPYLRERPAKSIACLPLMHHGKLVGVLYLENDTAAGAFHRARLERLEFLGGHAAVSLQNARLYDQIEAANAFLERRVRDRTAKLEGRNQDMRRVLDNVAQGLLTIDLEGRLSSERSRVVDRWLGAFEPHTSFRDYLARIDRRFAESFRLGFELLLEGILPETVLLSQLPSRLEHGGRSFRLSYEPIRVDEELTGFLIVIDDLTEALRRAQDESEQREELAVCRHLSRDRSGLLSFFAEAEAIIDLLSRACEANAEVRAGLHTLKGNAGMFGFSRLADCCHAAEDAIAEGADTRTHVEAVIDRCRALRQTFASVAGDNAGERVEVSREVLRSLASRLEAGTAPQDAAHALDRLLLEPLARPLSRAGAYARALAIRLGKGEIEVTVSDGGLLSDPQRSNVLMSALTHILRNAVDHGLETAEERACRGKGASRISLSASAEGREVLIDVSDDGRGIDWQRVRSVAQQRGLSCASHEALVNALFEPEFSTRPTISATSGRGVGLTAARAEVERLAGRIEVDSPATGGTRFRMRLPFEALGIQVAEPASRRRPSVVPPPDVRLPA